MKDQKTRNRSSHKVISLNFKQILKLNLHLNPTQLNNFYRLNRT